MISAKTLKITPGNNINIKLSSVVEILVIFLKLYSVNRCEKLYLV